MKKRVWCIAAALAMFSTLVMPGLIAEGATATTTVTGNIAPSISSIDPISGVQGTTYSNVIITGADFTGASAVSFGEGITVNSYTVNSTNQITANITVATNATAGSRNVSVTVSGVTGTNNGGFTVEAMTFTITAPSAISLGNMTKGQTMNTQSATPGSVSTNAVNWQVVARDTRTDLTPGYMRRPDGIALQTQLQIGKTSSPSTNAGDINGLVYTQSDGTSLNFHVSQYVDASNVVGSYSMTITFTGSPN